MLSCILAALTLSSAALGAHLSTLESAAGPLPLSIRQQPWLSTACWILSGISFHLLVAGAAGLAPLAMLMGGVATIIFAFFLMALAHRLNLQQDKDDQRDGTAVMAIGALALIAGFCSILASPIWLVIVACSP
jgi:hypothetical protein